MRTAASSSVVATVTGGAAAVETPADAPGVIIVCTNQFPYMARGYRQTKVKGLAQPRLTLSLQVGPATGDKYQYSS
jgi:hypothetical protein